MHQVKHLNVACAIIERSDLVLATQRSAAMTLPLKWEFPGGKIDPGETPDECLRREIMEELGVRVCVGRMLATATHNYPDFAVTLHPFVCTIDAGEIVLHEHVALAWLPPEELLSLDWAEADLPIIREYLAGNDADYA